MLNILVVDDSKTMHGFIEDCLKENNCHLYHAYNGQEAIREHTGKKVDLILMDWEMPVLSGPETVKEFNRAGISTPIIMITTKGKQGEIAQMMSEGVREYIVKPFTKDILIDKISDVAGGI